MKKYLIFLQLAVFFIASSCRKDLGNYEYTELNEMQIGNIQDEYVALTGLPFTITPEFTFDKGKVFNEADYTYQWIAADWEDIREERKTISTKSSLSGNLSLKDGKYQVFFRVTDKATGIFWQKQFKLDVTSKMAGGWLVLNENKGQARLDMLNYSLLDKQFTYYRDLPGLNEGFTLDGKPSFVIFTRNRDVLTNKTTNRVYIGTDKQTYSFNNHLYTWDNYRNLKTEVFRPTAAGYHAVSMHNNYLLDSEGFLSFEAPETSDFFGNGINRLSGNTKINISSQFAYTGKPNYAGSVIMYDTDMKRFLVHMGINSVSFLPRSADPAIFNPGDLKMDLVFIDYVWTTQNQTYALLKEPNSGQLKLLRFTGSASIFTPLAYDVIPNSQEMENAEFFTVDPTYGYLIYAVGNKLYSYNPFTKEHSLLQDYGSRKISKIKFQRLTLVTKDVRLLGYEKSLMVCTYDPAAVEKSGKMEFYSLGLDSKLTLQESYDGFDKIVDVSYRE